MILESIETFTTPDVGVREGDGRNGTHGAWGRGVDVSFRYYLSGGFTGRWRPGCWENPATTLMTFWIS